jgi:RNA polymerase sigma-70 factor, ECF subfamily
LIRIETFGLIAIMNSENDISALLVRVSRSDRAAFLEIYQRSSAKLYGIILRILRRRDIADEVMQEVYVRIWQRAGDFEPERASAFAWMASIARNRAIDEVRRNHPASIEDHPEVQELASEIETGLSALLRGEDSRRLADCLRELEPSRRQMVILAYCDGASREELATKYGQPVNTIKTWIRRSLAQLKGCLGG